MYKKIAATYKERIATLYVAASSFHHNGIDTLTAYDVLYKRYAGTFSDTEIKEAVEDTSDTSRRLAMYWKDKGRQYVPTKREIQTGCFCCPRCKTDLKQTVYKKHTHLYACPSCLFLIKPSDILDMLSNEDKEEAQKHMGWEPSISDPSKAFSGWI